MADLKITYRRSSIGQQERHKQTIKALGLRRLGMTVVRPDSPSLRGQLQAVRHLVVVEEVGDTGHNQSQSQG